MLSLLLLMLSAVLFAVLLHQPASFESILRQGLLALQKGDLSAAEQHLRQAAAVKPTSGIVWAALAQAHAKRGATVDADESARRASTLEPESPIVLRTLLLYWSGRGQPKPLVEVGLQSLKLQETADVHALVGKAYMAEGQLEKAVEHLRKAVAAEPSQESYVFEIGQALLRSEQFDDAAAVLEAGAKAVPASAQLPLALGVARYSQRRFAEAITAFLATIERQPSVEQPYVFLGRILEHAGDKLLEIRQRFQAYLTANPSSASAHLLLGKVLLAGNDADIAEVEKLLRRSLQLDNKSWEAHFKLGVIMAKQRSYAAAAQHLEEAIALNPREPVPHYHLARVYDRLGEKDKAAQQRSVHEQLLSAGKR